MEEKILTVEEIAELLRIAPNTIHSRRWQTGSGCPLIKQGKRLYSIHSDFWKWFRRGRN